MTRNKRRVPQSAATPGASTSVHIPQPRTILLFCWILNESTAAFPVDIDDDRTVGHLKKAIVKEKPRALAKFEADELTLWKVSIAITRNLKNEVTKLNFLDEQALLEGAVLSRTFPLPEPVEETLHIVIKRPPTPNLLDDDSPLKRSRTSHPDEVDKLIDEFLSTCRPQMRQLVMKANDTPSLLPSWRPDLADDTLKRHMSKLQIPAVRGRPSLLLHRLGEERTALDKNRIARIPDIFLRGQHTIFINTAGSGKSRLVLDGLCQRWGFYFAADETEVGSEDFRRIVCELPTYWDYKRAQTMNKSNSRTQESIDHTRETASCALGQVLLSRFLLLGLLVEEVEALEEQERLPWSQYRLLWVLLQVQPAEIFGRDIFLELAQCLRPADRYDLQTRTRNKYKELPPHLKKGSFYCVLDEAQVTTDINYRDFYSENGSTTRPLLKEIWRSWTTIFNPLEMNLILSGTGLNEEEITSTLSSNAFKPGNYAIKRDIGAFDDPGDQADYIQMYIPADWRDKKWQEFLKRSWAWFRGRYRNTATLVSLILEVGYQSPHRTINSYVEKFTAFRPTDADDWTKQETLLSELPSFSTLNFDRMNHMQATTLATALFDQAIYGTYSLQFAAKERATFVEYGFARTVTIKQSKATHTVLDEPIAILAALNWVNQTASLSHSEWLRRDIGKHSNSGNGFENYLAFYIRRFFESPQRLTELFKFRSDFDKTIDWKTEEFELVNVSRASGSDQPHVSLVTPDSGPSSNIGLRAEKAEDVLLWISTNDSQFAFCLPHKHFGPDLLFFLRSKVSGKLLLVMVQCKNYSQVPLEDLIVGVRTVTPDWLWKSKAIKYKTAADSVFPKGSPANASQLALETMNALRDIPLGLTATNAKFPILRVFASWPGDSKLDRSNAETRKTKAKNPADNEDLDDSDKNNDVDSHPLATLHLENFVRMSNELDINWFRGFVEQKEVIDLKRSAGEDLDVSKRKWAKQQGDDEMVL